MHFSDSGFCIVLSCKTWRIYPQKTPRKNHRPGLVRMDVSCLLHLAFDVSAVTRRERKSFCRALECVEQGVKVKHGREAAEKELFLYN